MKRGLPFRILLLGVVLGLILTSVTATTWLATKGFQTVIDRLLEKQIVTTLDAVNTQVEEFFAPTERLLRTFATRLESGAVPLDDPAAVAGAFADALRFERRVAWISFGYADGRFAGARLENGTPVLNLSTPRGGPPQEWLLAPDGTLRPLANPDLPASFDSRERDWFRRAASQDGLTWTPPYDFATGERGITVARPVRDRDGTLLGVLTVDFLLRDISDYLGRLKEKFRGDTLVFSLRGNVVATPATVESPAAVDHVRALLAGADQTAALRRSGDRLLFTFTNPGGSSLIGVQLANVPGDLGCVSAILIDRAAAFGALDRIVRQSVAAALVALLASLVAGYFLAARIATPLGQISDQVARIGTFDLRPTGGTSSSVREIRVLSDSIERMRAGLQSFSRYVPVDLVRDLLRHGGAAQLGGEKRVVTILFTDLVGFTAFAERNPPEVAVEALSAYFEGFAREIDAAGGVIDKFIGDGIMALFDAPERIAEPEAAACRAALRGLAERRRHPGIVAGGPLDVRVGLARGEVLVGNVGTETRFAYTAIGDCVNLGSRLEALNKRYGTHILASDGVRAAAGDAGFLWRRIDRVIVAGYREPLDVHELLATSADATDADRSLAALYPAALEHVAAGRLDEAERILVALADHDAASRHLLARIDDMRRNPAHPAWQGPVAAAKE